MGGFNALWLMGCKKKDTEEEEKKKKEEEEEKKKKEEAYTFFIQLRLMNRHN